ncbi:MAG: RdgB/HAM1 family non-canonical purine NTP pyrophosphatase [Clostridia bacterium]|nr:RdgB/HAM1 family non-canonical purine NTP pyrophosphatase [Clostridia bacterium]MBR4261042.1 RdgB/HAM1 family non-canonical purine NTP pyrophosphatase [Clostridia bacterium]
MNIIIASNNQGKIREFKKMLKPMGYTVLSQSEAGIDIEVEETGTTFKENATLKAEAIYNLKHTAVLADDSGIEIDYLNGEPGVYSARYMGMTNDADRRKCILEKLKDAKDDERGARFVCCICYIDENGNKQYAEGYWYGKIATEIRGENGFGYDPIFVPDGETITSGEMNPEEKNLKSHRANALKKLKEILG